MSSSEVQNKRKVNSDDKQFKRIRGETRRWVPAEEMQVLAYMRHQKELGHEPGVRKLLFY